MAEEGSGRIRLTRERIVEAAIAQADEHGLGRVTIRDVARRLGAKPMSMYYHVPSKEDLLAAMATSVLAEVEQPAAGAGWKASLRAMAIAYHAVLLRHPWAAGLMVSASGPDEVRFGYMESILRTLREAGFTPMTTDRAYHAIESHILGYTLWVVGMDLGDEQDVAALARDFLPTLSRERYPYLVEHVEQHTLPREPREDFVFGLDLILDGLERILDRRRGARS